MKVALSTKVQVAQGRAFSKAVSQRTTVRAPFVVRAEAAEAEAAPAPWSPPALNPNTPSPIFGGSTGNCESSGYSGSRI